MNWIIPFFLGLLVGQEMDLPKIKPILTVGFKKTIQYFDKWAAGQEGMEIDDKKEKENGIPSSFYNFKYFQYWVNENEQEKQKKI